MTALPGVSSWVVNQNPLLGNFTTITSAIASVASGTIFVCDGTYVEDFTIPDGINLVCWPAYWGSKAIIQGKMTVNGGTVNINGFELKTNGDNILSVTGANQSVVKFQNCNLKMSDGTGINCTSTNVNTMVFLSNCQGNVAANGYAIFNMQGGGIGFVYSRFTNDGASTTHCIANNANWGIENSYWEHPITMSGSGVSDVSNALFDSTTTVEDCITMTGSTTCFAVNARLQSGGSGSPVNVGGGCHFNNQGSVLNGGSSQLVKGAGLFEYGLVSTLTPGATLSSSQIAGDSAFSGPLSFDGGQNFLNTYKTGTWTPSLEFNGNNTGMVYASRSGFYTQIGNTVFGNFNVLITNKGSSTGNATIQGLPITAGPTNGNSYQNLGFLYGITLSSGYNYPYVSADAGTNRLSLGQTGTTGGTSLYMNNTNFANFSQIIGQFFYIIS